VILRKYEVKIRLLPFFALLAAVLCSASNRRSRSRTRNSLAYKLHSHDPLSAAAQVGQKMFFDESLFRLGQAGLQ